MKDQRDQLRTRDPQQVAQLSGAYFSPEHSEHNAPGTGTLALTFFQQRLIVRVPEYAVVTPDGDTVSTMTQALITAYLVLANGAPRAGEWIAFRELPGGLFYHQAFTGYTGGVIIRTLGDDVDAFRRGAVNAGGRQLTGVGDAAYEFQVLPKLWLAVVYWSGDQEDGFPSQANVLFDRAAGTAMIGDGLAILGSQLTHRILAGAG